MLPWAFWTCISGVAKSSGAFVKISWNVIPCRLVEKYNTRRQIQEKRDLCFHLAKCQVTPSHKNFVNFLPVTRLTALQKKPQHSSAQRRVKGYKILVWFRYRVIICPFATFFRPVVGKFSLLSLNFLEENGTSLETYLSLPGEFKVGIK